ncbi:hypothetical protein ACR2WJ_27235, partial [Klebsiella pneumoniae]
MVSKFIGVYLFNLLIAIILTLTLIGTITDSIESTLAQIIVGMFIIITIYGILSALIPILVHKAV